MRAPGVSQFGDGHDRRHAHHGCGALGDFTIAAAADNLEDVAGSRRRRVVVARGVGGGAVGACVDVFTGWRWGQLGRRKAIVAPMNSAGVGRNFM